MADEPKHEAPAGRPGTSDLSGFWRWVRAWLVAPDRGHARLLIAGVVAMTLAQVLIQIRFNTWNRDFFDALDKRNAQAFQHQIVVFLVLAALSMAAAV